MEVWSLVGKITMQGFAAAETKLTSLEKKIKRNEAAFKGLRTAGLAIVAVVGAIAGGAVTAAVKFEDAFAGVRKTVEATEEQFDVLRQGILAMSERLPLTATEIAAVAEAAGQLGIATEDILDFTEVMVQLGISTNIAADVAATSLARFANITGMAADEYDKLGSAIVDLGNNFATTESEIVDMSMRIAGAGTAAGMTETEILGLATSLSSLGLRAEAGGTAISNVLLTMSSSVIKGGEELDQFAEIAGMSSNAFATAYRDNATDALLAFMQGLGNLNDIGADTSTMLDNLGLGGIRVEDMLLRTSNAEGLVTDAINTANKAWEENIALQEEVDKRNETAASMLTELKNTATNLFIAIGEGLLPVLKSMVEKIQPIIQSFSDWIKENQGLVKWLLALAGTGGALLLFVGLLPKVIGFVSSFVSGIKLLGNATKVLTAIQWLWNAAMTANPIGLIIAGVAALIAAGIALWKNWSKITGWFSNLFGKTKEEVVEAADVIEEREEELTEDLKAEYKERLDAKIDAINSERMAAENALEESIELIKEQYDYEEKVVKSKKELLEEYTEAAKDAIDEELKAAREATDEKLSLIDEEYYAKLKLLDEETAAIVSEYQDQIDALNEQTDQEEEELEEQREKEKKAELKAAIDSAETAEERAEAIAEYEEYIAKIKREKELEEREDEIETLKQSIENEKAIAKEDAERLEEEREANITLEEELLANEETRLENEKLALDTALETELARIEEEMLAAIDAEERKYAALVQRLADEEEAIKAYHARILMEEESYQALLANVEAGGTSTTVIGADGSVITSIIPPSMDTGGVISEPTLLTSLRTGQPYAIAAKDGKPETVLPNGASGGVTVNVANLVIREEADVDRVAKKLYKEVLNGLRSKGSG